jgi:hypothetical protein
MVRAGITQMYLPQKKLLGRRRQCLDRTEVTSMGTVQPPLRCLRYLRRSGHLQQLFSQVHIAVVHLDPTDDDAIDQQLFQLRSGGRQQTLS